jgi:hypothetical protein
MERNTILRILVVAGMLFMASVRAGAEGAGVNAGIDYFSNYFWRGYDFYSASQGVLLPFLTLTAGESGFSICYVGEYAAESAGDGASEKGKLWYGADFGLEYKTSFAQAVTVGAKAWYFWYYNSERQNRRMGNPGRDESYCTGTVFFTVDILPLSPTVVYNHDYYIDDYDCDRKANRDFYVQFLLSHTVRLTGEAGLILKAGAGYFNQQSAELESDPSTKALRGVSDIQASADLSVSVGPVTIHGGFFYAYVPDKDFYRVTTDTGDVATDRHRFWSGFGASYSL